MRDRQTVGAESSDSTSNFLFIAIAERARNERLLKAEGEGCVRLDQDIELGKKAIRW